jgi:hypothetical protein
VRSETKTVPDPDIHEGITWTHSGNTYQALEVLPEAAPTSAGASTRSLARSDFSH